jgi:hypothetical protein
MLVLLRVNAPFEVVVFLFVNGPIIVLFLRVLFLDGWILSPYPPREHLVQTTCEFL